jgi:hypothetical protein
MNVLEFSSPVGESKSYMLISTDNLLFKE